MLHAYNQIFIDKYSRDDITFNDDLQTWLRLKLPEKVGVRILEIARELNADTDSKQRIGMLYDGILKTYKKFLL